MGEYYRELPETTPMEPSGMRRNPPMSLPCSNMMSNYPLGSLFVSPSSAHGYSET